MVRVNVYKLAFLRSKYYVCRESPAATINRMCYGYLLNDWAVFFSSGLTLLTTAMSILAGATHHVSSNA